MQYEKDRSREGSSRKKQEQKAGDKHARTGETKREMEDETSIQVREPLPWVRGSARFSPCTVVSTLISIGRTHVVGSKVVGALTHQFDVKCCPDWRGREEPGAAKGLKSTSLAGLLL